MTYKRLLTALFAMVLLTFAAPPAQAATENQSPLAAYVDANDFSAAYKEWQSAGSQGIAPSALDLSYLGESYTVNDASTMRSGRNGSNLPSRYDLRDKGLVDPVIDQGNLSICWAIAAGSSASGSIRDQFPQLTFSAMHTAWFSDIGNEESEYDPLATPYLRGSNDARAVGTLAAWKGPVSSAIVSLIDESRPQLDERLRYRADYHLQDAYYMPSGSHYQANGDLLTVPTDVTKKLLMTVGPVTTSYYSHGLNTYNPETHAVYNSTPRATDHAVLIVGWDDNYAKENFVAENRPSHDGAWLVRNSWGTSWGDDGYFWLSYEDATLISGNAYVVEEADNYATNYQYDTIGWGYSIMTTPSDPTTATAANIFTAEGDEQLEAVSFYTTDANTRYRISVYTEVSAGEPTSGICVLPGQSGQEAYAGYHTIELEKAIALKKGDAFSIVVELDNPTYEKPVAIEWCPAPYYGYVPQYMGSGGESYVKLDGKWQDVCGPTDVGFTITNVCIKGFTNPLPESGSAVAQVRFSEMEGPVADGTMLQLASSDDNAAIYWSDGGEYRLYTGAIALDELDTASDRMTIRAYAEVNGARGNIISKTYQRAEAQLTDLAVKSGDHIWHLDVSKSDHHLTLPIECENVQLMAQSASALRLNDTLLESNTWSKAASLSPGESTTFTVRAGANGKSETLTSVTLTRASDNGSGSDDRPLYAIRINDKPDHGSILFSPNQAAERDTVTLTVKPDKDYTLDTLVLTAADGSALGYRAIGGGRYTFTMPDSAVDIAITFFETGDGTLPFDDVLVSDWFYKSVQYVYEKALMVGTDVTLFEPQSPVTRAMIWATLARQARADTGETAVGDEWYSAVQRWAVAEGITDGLRPNDSVSRQELITMLHRAQGAPSGTADLSHYSDASEIADWAQNALTWGVEKGLITGLTDTTLAPEQGATRAQLAAILERYVKMDEVQN